jgi:5'-nucleotidase
VQVCGRRAPGGRAVALLAATLLFTACSGDDNGSAAGSTSTTTAARRTLEVVVTNDDGVAGAGLDAIVEALRDEPGIEVTVVAPATDKSGTGGTTTPGTVATEDATTNSGFPAVAVEGFPADTIAVALDVLGLTPDLVVSGINLGQNIGPLTQVSGTVGAALAAGRRGIPALAVSQGLGSPPDYPAGVEQALIWIRAHRDVTATPGEPATVTSLNVPTCTTGEVRGVVEVPVAGEGRPLDPVDCASTLERPPDDVVAFRNGYATLSVLPAS